MKLKHLLKSSNIKTEKINNFLTFRRKLIIDSIKWDHIFNKSPNFSEEQKKLQEKLFGESFVYERNIQYPNIENKYRKILNCEKILLYNSGMATIANLINTYIEGYRNQKLNIVYTCGYFETEQFIEKLNFPVKIKKVYEEDGLKEEIVNNDIDILFLEPVAYNSDMTQYDIYSIISFYNDKVNTNRIKIIIIDITLVSHFNIDVQKIQELLIKKNVYCVLVQSLIKLYQFGLEMSNGGMLCILGEQNKYIDDYFNRLKINRMIYSANLKLSELRLYNNGFLYNKKFLMKYITTVQRNNEYVAKNVKNDIFKKISHPALNKKYNHSVAPFIVLKLRDDTEMEYDKIISRIFKYTKKNKIKLYYGSSFGFYSTRIEKIIYDVEARKCFFKLSVGYDYKYVNRIIKLLNTL